MKNIAIVLGILLIIYLLRNRLVVQVLQPGQVTGGSVKPVTAPTTGISGGSVEVTQQPPQTTIYYNGGYDSGNVTTSSGDVPEGSVIVY